MCDESKAAGNSHSLWKWETTPSFVITSRQQEGHNHLLPVMQFIVGTPAAAILLLLGMTET